MKKLMVLALSTALAGCTTYTKKQCETMDWHLKGTQTSLQGSTIESGKAYFAKACKDVPMNTEAFQKGYDVGLKQFCTPENARQFASNGGSFPAICPDSVVNTRFISSFHSGREEFLEKKIKSLESDLDQLKSEVDNQKSDVSKLQSDLSSCESSKH